jgi:hypothetical protein
MIELAYGTCTMLGKQSVAVGGGLLIFTSGREGAFSETRISGD